MVYDNSLNNFNDVAIIQLMIEFLPQKKVDKTWHDFKQIGCNINMWQYCPEVELWATLPFSPLQMFINFDPIKDFLFCAPLPSNTFYGPL